MVYTVYVLQDKNGLLYKGYTKNIKRRFAEHKRGKTKTTSKMPDLKIVYVEKFNCGKEARKREKYFKTAAGRRFLKGKILTSSSGSPARTYRLVRAGNQEVAGSNPAPATGKMRMKKV